LISQYKSINEPTIDHQSFSLNTDFLKVNDNGTIAKKSNNLEIIIIPLIGVIALIYNYSNRTITKSNMQ